jgi:hypothetical protein
MKNPREFYYPWAVKRRIEMVLSGEVPLEGDYLCYGTKKTAEQMMSALKEEGVNCYMRKSVKSDFARGYDVVFSDITEKIANALMERK